MLRPPLLLLLLLLLYYNRIVEAVVTMVDKDEGRLSIIYAHYPLAITFGRTDSLHIGRHHSRRVTLNALLLTLS